MCPPPPPPPQVCSGAMSGKANVSAACVCVAVCVRAVCRGWRGGGQRCWRPATLSVICPCGISRRCHRHDVAVTRCSMSCVAVDPPTPLAVQLCVCVGSTKEARRARCCELLPASPAPLCPFRHCSSSRPSRLTMMSPSRWWSRPPVRSSNCVAASPALHRGLPSRPLSHVAVCALELLQRLLPPLRRPSRRLP